VLSVTRVYVAQYSPLWQPTHSWFMRRETRRNMDFTNSKLLVAVRIRFGHIVKLHF